MKVIPSVMLTLIGITLIIVPLGRDFGQPSATALWVIPIALIPLVLRPQSQLLLAKLIVLIAALTAQWGILQVAIQSDLGLLPLGEEELDVSRSGVAKFSQGFDSGEEEKIIRSYGPFGHPNIFGTALALSSILLLALRVARRSAFLILWYLLLIATLLTFSRLAWTMFCFGSIAMMIWGPLTLHNLRKCMVPIAVTLLVFSPLIYARLTDNEDRAVIDRNQGYLIAESILSELGYFRGVGIGNYAPALREYAAREKITMQPWEFQAVHSVPFLAAVEWGVALASLITISILGTLIFVRAWGALLLIIVSTPLWLFDHFLLTDAGGLLWWLVAAIVFQQIQLQSHQKLEPSQPTQ